MYASTKELHSFKQTNEIQILIDNSLHDNRIPLKFSL